MTTPLQALKGLVGDVGFADPDKQSDRNYIFWKARDFITEGHADALIERLEWRPISAPPDDIEPGHERYVIAAIRRAHNGRVYSVPAVVVNKLPLYSETPEDADGQNWSRREIPDTDDWYNMEVTGWYEYGADPEYDYSYTPLCQNGDELVGWLPLPEAPHD